MKQKQPLDSNHGSVSVATAPAGFNKFRNERTTAPTNYASEHTVSVTFNPHDYGSKYANSRSYCLSWCLYFYIWLRAQGTPMYFSGLAQ